MRIERIIRITQIRKKLHEILSLKNENLNFRKIWKDLTIPTFYFKLLPFYLKKLLSKTAFCKTQLFIVFSNCERIF